MLSKKYPRQNCRIEFQNYLIGRAGCSNHDCAFVLDPESILLGGSPQNPFSTATANSANFDCIRSSRSAALRIRERFHHPPGLHPAWIANATELSHVSLVSLHAALQIR